MRMNKQINNFLSLIHFFSAIYQLQSHNWQRKLAQLTSPVTYKLKYLINFTYKTMRPLRQIFQNNKSNHNSLDRKSRLLLWYEERDTAS